MTDSEDFTIEVDVRLTPADATALRWKMLWQRPAAVARTLGTLLVGMTLLTLVALDGEISWVTPVIYAAALAGVLLWQAFVVPRRAFRSTPALQGTQHWAIDDAELRRTTTGPDGRALGDIRLSWEALHRVAETRDAFLLLQSRTMAMPIPKRCFASAADLERFRALVAQHAA